MLERERFAARIVWKVRGHERWQRVGPGRTFLRRVWVREHTKGPLDKPLVERDSITSLDR